MIGDTVAHVLPTLAVPLEVAMLARPVYDHPRSSVRTERRRPILPYSSAIITV